MRRWFLNLPTFWKLTAAFAMLFVLIGGGNLASLSSAAAIRGNVDVLNSGILPATALLATTTPVAHSAASGLLWEEVVS